MSFQEEIRMKLTIEIFQHLDSLTFPIIDLLFIHAKKTKNSNENEMREEKITNIICAIGATN